MSRNSLHTKYTIDGVPVPSVTTIIYDVALEGADGLVGWAAWEASRGNDWKKVRDQAGRIGRMAHAMIEAKLTGGGIPLNLNEYAKREIEVAEICFQGFLEFLETNEIDPDEVETELVHPDLRYGGTVDFIGEINGRRAIMDFKTSSKLRVGHRVQIAAYRELWNYHNDELLPTYLLQLDKKQVGFTLKEVASPDTEWEIFKHLREVYELKRKL